MAFWVLLIGSILVNLLQWFFISNLLNQNKQLEDTIEKAVKNNDKINEDVLKYHQVLLGLFQNAYTEITRVDKKGSFSSDDEVGWSFKLLMNTIRDVTEKLETLKRTDGEKE